MTLPSVHEDITELDPPVLPVPEDTLYLGDRLDQMVAELNDIRKALQEGQRPRPTLIPILTFDGCAAGALVGRRATSTRLRVESVIAIVTLTTTVMSLMVGNDRKFTVRVNTGQGSPQYTLPINIDAGVDITAEIETAQAAGGRAGFYVIAYPDGADD